MSEQWLDLLQKLPANLGGHLVLSLTALLCGLLVSLPLGIVASRRPRLAEWVLGIAGVIQTVPSLALLALLVVMLGSIGFLPAFIALTLYSVLPILANTVTGIRGVDPTLTEAARGLGMNERQILFRVQLPLALPVIIAGIRTSTVLVVGTATLVTPVGGQSLGNYIFSGLESLNDLATLVGCVATAILALLLDQLVRLMEVAARRRSPRLAWGGLVGLLLVFGCGLYEPLAHALAISSNHVAIATGPFTEQHILDETLAQQLEAADFQVQRRPGTSEGIQFKALFNSQVDCIVNYTGNIWTLLMKRSEPKDSQQTLREVSDYLLQEHGVVCLGSLGFENAYAVAMPASEAQQINKSLAGLAEYAAAYRRKHREPLKVGGDNQIFSRPEWTRLMQRYRVDAADIQTVPMDPTLMYTAVKQGEVQAIVAYTSDGRIPAYALTLLADPQQAFPPYDAVLLLSPRAAKDPNLRTALQPLVKRISQESMQQANYRVDVEKWPPPRAARELLGQVHREKAQQEVVQPLKK